MVRKIGLDGRGLATSVLDLACHLRQRSPATGDADHRRAGSRQCFGYGPADSGTGAGDRRDTPAEIEKVPHCHLAREVELLAGEVFV